MSNNNISKEVYIITTHRIIEKEGIHAVSIRRLSKELGCNTANLYRYFNGLEELLLYASLRYLRGYLREVSEILQQNESVLKQHYDVWECFARNSFYNPHVFNNLFFGKYSDKLNTIILDYYNIFREEIFEMDDYMRKVFLSGDFRYRDFLMIVKCAQEGFFSYDDARILNQICIHLYKGYLKDIIDQEEKGEETDAEDIKNMFMYHMDCILKKYVKKKAPDIAF